MKYLVFVIQAYEQMTDTGNLIDACEIQLIDVSYEHALKRAKQIISHKFYRLNMVIEKYKENK